MEMEGAYKVLEEQKEALEKILIGYRGKLELSDSLGKAYNELLPKFQEAKKEIDRQSREIGVKSEEIELMRKTCEDLKSSLREKECAIRQVSAANEQIQLTCKQKVEEAEARNCKLASSLLEASGKAEENARQIDAYKKETERLKLLLSDSQKKCLEAEKRAQAAKELREREEVISKVEQEMTKIGEKLKWKVEQFKHLEEAHGKLQMFFHESEEEWRAEKSRLVDEMCTLQTNLESQSRVVGDLQLRLQMCNQALAHEESRRKLMEIQVSESRTSYENVVMECEEVKRVIQKLTQGRDEEIADVRNILASKESRLKEVEIRNMLLVQENQNLQTSVEELKVDLDSVVKSKMEIDKDERKHAHNLERELDRKKRKIEDLQETVAQLQEEVAQSRDFKSHAELEIKKLRDECKANRKQVEAINLAKEEIGKAVEEHEHIFACELAARERTIEELQQEIAHLREDLLEMSKSNSDVEDNLRRLQGKFKSINQDLESSLRTKTEIEELLAKQTHDSAQELELKERRIEGLLQELTRLREALERTGKLISVAEVEMKALQDEKEDIGKDMERLVDAKVQMEKEFRMENRNLTRELDLKDRKMGDMEQEVAQLREKLEKTSYLNAKSEMEIRNLQDECEKTRNDLKFSIKSKEREIEDLRQEILCLRESYTSQQDEAVDSARAQANIFLEKERSFLKIILEKDNELKCLHADLALLEQEHAWKEIETFVTSEQTRTKFEEMNNEKDKVMHDLKNQILSQEQLSKSVETAISLELADRQFEIDTLNGSLKKMMAMHFLSLQENEFSNMLKLELEKDLLILSQRLQSEEKLVADMKNCVEELKHEIEMQRGKLENHINVMQLKEKSLGVEINGLRSAILERNDSIGRLLSERECILVQISEMTESLGKLSLDENLIRRWQSLSKEAGVCKSTREAINDYRLNQKNSDLLKQKIGIAENIRLPLKEHNS